MQEREISLYLVAGGDRGIFCSSVVMHQSLLYSANPKRISLTSSPDMEYGSSRHNMLICCGGMIRQCYRQRECC